MESDGSYTSIITPSVEDFASSHMFVIFFGVFSAVLLVFPILLAASSIIGKFKESSNKRKAIYQGSLFILSLQVMFVLLFVSSSFFAIIYLISMICYLVLYIRNAKKPKKKMILFYFSPVIYLILYLCITPLIYKSYILSVILFNPLGYLFFTKPKSSDYIIQGILLFSSIIMGFMLEWVSDSDGIFGLVYPYDLIKSSTFTNIFGILWCLTLLAHVIMYAKTFFRLTK